MGVWFDDEKEGQRIYSLLQLIRRLLTYPPGMLLLNHLKITGAGLIDSIEGGGKTTTKKEDAAVE